MTSDDATAAPAEPPGTAGLDPRAVFRVALVVIPLGLLGNIAFSLLATDREILRAIDRFPREWLLVGLGLALLPWVTNTLRLLLWTRFLDYRLGLVDAFRVTLAVDLGAAVSPTAVGGGFLKWGLLVQRGIRPGAAASLTALPTVEDAIFFAMAIPVAVVISAAWELQGWQQIAGAAASRVAAVAVIAVVVFLLVWILARLLLAGLFGIGLKRRLLRRVASARRRLGGAWSDARGVFALIRTRGKARFAVSMLLTAIQWSARYSVITALAAFLGASVRPVLFWLLQWVVFTLMTLVPTPGATGGAEVSFVIAYGGLLPDGVLGIATAGWRFLTFYLQVGLAALLFPLLGRRSR